MSVEDYIKALRAWLYLQFYNGRLALPGEKKELDRENDDDVAKYENYLNALTSRVQVEGITEQSPYFTDIMAYAGPMIQAKQQGLLDEQAFDRALEERGMALAESRDVLAERKVTTGEQQWAAEFGLSREALDFNKWKTEQEFAIRQREAATEWQATIAGREFEQQRAQATQLWAGVVRPEQDRGNQRKDWDKWRANILGELDPDRDWIQKAELEAKVNPFGGDITPSQELRNVEDELARYERAGGRILKQMKDPNDPLTIQGVANPTTPQEQAAAQILKNWQGLTQDVTRQEEEVALGRIPMETETTATGGTIRRTAQHVAPAGPTTPATPACLGQLYPELGTNISKITPTALSGQAFGRLDPSQQQQWAGFVEWAGGRPQDLLAQTQRRLPQPTRGTRVSPARQF